MHFNSLAFLAFAAVFFALWPVLRRWRNVRWGYLTVASFLFYGWWDWRFLFVISATGLLNFGAGLGMAAWPRLKRTLLVLSVAGNIGSLAVFKYSGFFADTLSAILAAFGIDVALKTGLPDLLLILPVGISFYTFQAMSYTIDVYRGQLPPTHNVLHFFAYLSMFPQLVAGPIVRARDLLPQLERSRTVTEAEQWEGLQLVVFGFFKKVVIADSLAPRVNGAFEAVILSESTVFWWCIITAFAFQIYCDFSGYTDIARGLAKWMGYDFLDNFNHPYVSTSLREFWTRWHISLSTWFRDYMYFSLGGSRVGKWRAQANMWITMLLSGLWHGAQWHFVMWGAVHAFLLNVERLTGWPDRLKRVPGGRALACACVILQVWIAWVFFRAASLSQALHVLKCMFSFSGGWDTGLGARALPVLALVVLREAHVYCGLDRRQPLLPSWRRRLDPAFLSLMVVACVYLRGQGSEFIYFAF